MKNKTLAVWMVFFLLLGWGCSGGSGTTFPVEDSGHAHKEAEAAGADLKRPETELFAASCEHHRPAYQCDECRYSVGVVKVPPSLLSEGLVQLVTVDSRNWEAPIELTGEVRFDERLIAHLSPQTEGVIHRVWVTLGQNVSKGQPLLEIDSPALGQAQSAFLEARATADLTRRTFQRQQDLLNERITSEKEFLAARKEDEEARIREKAAAETLIRFGLSPAEIETLAGETLGEARGKLVMRAPFAGSVLELDAVPGEFAQPGRNHVLVGNLSHLWVYGDLFERDLAAVLGQAGGGLPARVTVRAFPGEEFPGRLEVVGATMDETTRTVKVRVGLPNPGARLRPGMFARVILDLPGQRSALGIPEAAVLSDEGTDFVFRRHEGEFFIRRPVTTGLRRSGFVEIIEGLDVGQTIVANGSFLLKSDVLRSKMGAGCAD